MRLEEAERKIGRMRAIAVGEDPDGFTVEYPREYDIRALLGRAAEAKELLALKLGPTANAEIRKNVAAKALRAIPAGLRAKINAEIVALSKKEAEAGTELKAPPKPPDQSRQPPGHGSGEDRMTRTMSPADAEEMEDMDAA